QLGRWTRGRMCGSAPEERKRNVTSIIASRGRCRWSTMDSSWPPQCRAGRRSSRGPDVRAHSRPDPGAAHASNGTVLAPECKQGPPIEPSCDAAGGRDRGLEGALLWKIRQMHRDMQWTACRGATNRSCAMTWRDGARTQGVAAKAARGYTAESV